MDEAQQVQTTLVKGTTTPTTQVEVHQPNPKATFNVFPVRTEDTT